MAESEAIPATGDDPETEIKKRADFVTYWLDQLNAYDGEFDEWTKRCRRIIRRYRDERKQDADGKEVKGARFNSLWSNVQTLLPAIYINPPKPVVERRYLDKDPLARISSMTLERAIEVQIDIGKLHTSTRKAVLDYLLVGRGVVWERYEPTYGEPQQAVETTDATTPTDGAAQPPRPVTYEKVCTDYVGWEKFKHSPSALWDDVWWVEKDEYLTRKELRARFTGIDEITGKPIADLIPMRDGTKGKEDDNKEKKRKQPRALVCEIWDKTNREVIFIAPDWPHQALERTPDPLGLTEFWPCPQPLYATLTNDSLVPIPDYTEYQDQADEIDDLTNRIAALTDAIKVVGVYDASIPELKRILKGGDNLLVGVRNWAELTSKGGVAKSMDFVPIKEVAEALLILYDARERVKADLAEITGISDIVRGQSQGGNKTATEQRIKGQFASLRLEDRKKEVSRFACDTIRVMAEITAEQFSPEILAEMTGMIPFITDEIKAEAPPPAPEQPATPPVSPPAGAGAPAQPDSPPMAAGGLPTVQAPPMAPAMPPPPDPAQLAQQRFMEACVLLKDDKMRTFRIDIETDSTVEVDKQQAKEAVVEMFTAVGGFLEKAAMIGQLIPELTPALGQSILFAFRTFGAGRDVEGLWEQAIDKLTQKSKNPAPKPPSPEQIKAEAEQQKMKAQAEQMQQKAALEQQKAQQDFQLEQAKAKMEIEREQMKLQIEREKMELQRQKMQLDAQAAQQKMALDSQAAERDAAIDEQAAIRDDEIAQRAAERDESLADNQAARDERAGERDFKLAEKTAKLKATQAAKKAKEPA